MLYFINRYLILCNYWFKIYSMGMEDKLKHYFNSWAYTPEKSFLLRLIEENNWDESFARRAIAEYIKFLTLILDENIKATPSKIIDIVWHTHLLYTREYMKMGKIKSEDYFLHHDPSISNEDDTIYQELYLKTIENYINRYKTKPPKDIW